MFSFARVLSPALLALICISGQSVLAVEKCKIKQDKKTGAILVDAKSVVGPFTWGGEAGEEVNTVFNPADCLSGTNAKGCLLGDPATGAASMPPAGCTVYLTDGVQDCAARVPGCTPGLRPGDAMTPYTQWGASSCTSPDATELHAGWAFSNQVNHGGSADPICFEAGASTGATQNYVGDLLYAVTISGGAVHEGAIVDNTRLQCAQCSAPSTACFVHYGSQTCPAGSDPEYTGHLYGAHYTHQAAVRRICVESTDYDATVTNNPDSGAHLYPTRLHHAPATDVPTGTGVMCAVCCSQ